MVVKVLPTSLALSILMTMLPTASAMAGDPWYVDLDGHWARHYIRVLWEEGVTDGFRRAGRTHFRPDEPITRAAFILMTAKAFGLSPQDASSLPWRDVRPDLAFDGRVPVTGYLAAAWKAGIVQGFPDGTFRPTEPTSRQEAVAMLVRALRLTEGAIHLDEARLHRQLHRFFDGEQTDPTLQREMAVAIWVGMIRGYPDGTLRPARSLTRAEAATLLYRACACRLVVSPTLICPQEEGTEGSAELRIDILKNRNVKSWRVEIRRDLDGEVVWNTGWEPWVQSAARVTWTGHDQRGRGVPAGVYLCQAEVRDRRGQSYLSVPVPLEVEYRRLSCQAYPNPVQAGSTLHLRAQTEGEAVAVRARCALLGEQWVDLTPTAPPGTSCNVWRGELPVPSGTEGQDVIHFVAVFARGTKEGTVHLTVKDPTFLSGSVHPNPCVAGTQLTVLAVGSPNLLAVEASGPWGFPISLRRDGQGWSATVVLPRHCPEGTHPVMFTARSTSKEVQRQIWLEVLNPLESIVPTLTR